MPPKKFMMKILRHERQRYNDIVRNLYEEVNLLGNDAFEAAMDIYGKLSRAGELNISFCAEVKISSAEYLLRQLLHLTYSAREAGNQLVMYWRTTPEFQHDPNDHLEYAAVKAIPALRLLKDEAYVINSAGQNADPTPDRLIYISTRQRMKVAEKLNWRLSLMLSHVRLLAAEGEYSDATAAALVNDTEFAITDDMLMQCHDEIIGQMMRLKNETMKVIAIFQDGD